MNVSAALITAFQMAKAVQPGKCSLNDLTMFSKLFTTLNPTPGNPWRDSSLSQDLAIMPTVVAFVGTQFLGALPWSAMLLSNGWAGEGVRWIEANGVRSTKE